MSESTASGEESLLFRPLKATSDQEIVWQMLMHAAHEEDLEAVKTSSLLQPYAKEFGLEEGDVGVLALTGDGKVPVGAAWVRPLGVNGFATAHLKDSDDFQELKSLPELAIACLPEQRGKGLGTSLLTALFEAAKDKHPGICLSCRADNPAIRLYERVGFVTVPGTELINRVGGKSVTMQYLF